MLCYDRRYGRGVCPPGGGVGAERDTRLFLSLDLARAENDIVEENLFTGPRVLKSSFHWPVEKGAV